MSKKAVVWIRDDFRIKNNSALSYATNNYDTVTALYIYNICPKYYLRVFVRF